MNLRKPLAALVLASAVALCATGCGNPLVAGDNSNSEDCDAEDYANREDDCGFTDRDRRRSPAVKKTVSTKPAPKVPIKKSRPWG